MLKKAKKFFSCFSPRYVRSLAYMLQASEYKIADYVTWLWRVEDFNTVETRKKLNKTPKAIAVLAFGWILVFIALGFIVYFLCSVVTPWNYVLALGALILSPYWVAYGIIVPLWCVEIIVQKPIEMRTIKRATQKLAAHKATKIAIAGSFGKTSMREILKTVLAEGKKVSAPPHSYNTPLGISTFVNSLNGDEEVLVFELGEYYPGDIKTLCNLVQPDIGIITGINEAHLEKFKTVDQTTKTIFELADYLGGRPVYVNGENHLAAQNARSSHFLYSREGIKNTTIEKAHTGLEGTSFSLVNKGAVTELHSSLLGMHQIGPLAAAADIASVLGLSASQIQRGIQKTKPFDHRLEPKTDAAGVITLDDSYNGNPDGVKAVIDFLASLKGYRRFYVTPGLVEMGSRTKAVHVEIGKQLARAGIEKVVLIRNSVTPFIEQGLRQANFKGEVIWFDAALRAFAALPLITVKGDIVLLQNDWPDQYA